MNQATVNKILYLAEKLKDKPALLELFESGEEGWSKLEIVAFIANPDTDEAWTEKVRNLSCETLKVYVQHYREMLKEENDSKNKQLQSVNFTDVGKTQSVELNKIDHKETSTSLTTSQEEEPKTYPNTYDQTHQNYNFSLSDEVIFKLRLIKQKLEKKQKEILSWNEVFNLWKFEDL